MLRLHYVELAATRQAWAKLDGKACPTAAVLLAELDRTMAQVASLGKLATLHRRLCGYRPLVSPLQGKKMNVHLRPDFAVRGIKHR